MTVILNSVKSFRYSINPMRTSNNVKSKQHKAFLVLLAFFGLIRERIVSKIENSKVFFGIFKKRAKPRMLILMMCCEFPQVYGLSL